MMAKCDCARLAVAIALPLPCVQNPTRRRLLTPGRAQRAFSLTKILPARRDGRVLFEEVPWRVEQLR